MNFLSFNQKLLKFRSKSNQKTVIKLTCLNCIILLLSVESYVKSLGRPDLLDLLVHPASEDMAMEDVEDLRPSKRKIIFTEVPYAEFLPSTLFACKFH